MQIQNVSDSILAALNQSRIVLALQPIIAVATGETAFHEALMRVVQEDGTLILPADVLPVAEKTGLVQLIDHRMLELAVQELAKIPISSSRSMHRARPSSIFIGRIGCAPLAPIAMASPSD